MLTQFRKDILDRLHGSKYFSSWDLKSGYYQILMDENSIAKTAFSTHDQHWEFIRCPFGLKIYLHLIGHFMVKSTLDRLDKDYFCRRMKEDIEHVIKQCEVSASNEKERIYNHPARAIPISGIFDMVGADLVFGLPETEEGYVGIIVLTDAFTKFPYAKPI